jgi:hypothetical protein
MFLSAMLVLLSLSVSAAGAREVSISLLEKIQRADALPRWERGSFGNIER